MINGAIGGKILGAGGGGFLTDGQNSSNGSGTNGGECFLNGGDGGTATLAVTAAKTITGNILAASDGEGLITTANGKVTVVGAVGTSSKAIKTLTIGDTGGFSINGDLYVDGIDNFTGTVGLLEFTSDSAAITQIVSGTIQGINSGTGADDITLTSFLDDTTLTLGLGIITNGEAKSTAFGTSSTTVSGYRFLSYLGKNFGKWELLGGYQYSTFSYEKLSSANDYSASGGLFVIGFGMEF